MSYVVVNFIIEISLFVSGNLTRLKVGDSHLAGIRLVLGCFPSFPVGHRIVEVMETGRNLCC